MTISGTCIHVYTLVCSSSNCLQRQWCENPWMVPARFKPLISGYLQQWLTNSCTFPTVFQLGRFLGVIYPLFPECCLMPFLQFPGGPAFLKIDCILCFSFCYVIRILHDYDILPCNKLMTVYDLKLIKGYYSCHNLLLSDGWLMITIIEYFK